MKISILIATKNRPVKIHQCVQSILRSTLKDFELLVVDQSVEGDTRRILHHIHDPRLRVITHLAGGKTAALNKGIGRAKGDIIAFTDDDCIAAPHWLSTVKDYFASHGDIAAVFGSTYPYRKTQRPGLICPSTFMKKHATIITELGPHISDIGFGNNMAIRAISIGAVSGFRPWLGPGSFGATAEEAEITSRLLARRHHIAYLPRMRVYHDRWITPAAMRRQDVSYFRGEAMCYAYFAASGYAFAARFLSRMCQKLTARVWKSAIRIAHDGITRDIIGSLFWHIRISISTVIGICLGTYFAVFDPLPFRNN
jgi:glycosyltransferase involved in cell wall biosynthesis